MTTGWLGPPPTHAPNADKQKILSGVWHQVQVPRLVPFQSAPALAGALTARQTGGLASSWVLVGAVVLFEGEQRGRPKVDG